MPVGSSGHPIDQWTAFDTLHAARRSLTCAMRVAVCDRGVGGDDRFDQLTPLLVIDTEHEGIDNGGMRLQGFLDFLGEDLPAARVAAVATPAEEHEGPVCFHAGPVAGERVAGAVDLAEGRRVGRGDGHPAGGARSGRDLPVVLVEDLGARTRRSNAR